jgi:threonine dehydrogenase-like Zn-dependent dehydrogenase
MRAVVVHDFGEWSVEEVADPEPAADELLLETRRVQLSVTECNLFRGEDIAHRDAVESRLETGSVQLFGHEFCGEVVETGSEVDEFAEGDRVYAPGKIPCHDCPYCEAGMWQNCPNKVNVGYERPGATAEYVALPPDPLSKVPEGVSDAEAAAMQPFANAIPCVDDADVRPGDTVVVLGTGVMGYGIGQLALHHGAGEVVAVDVVEQKLAFARREGMTPVDASEENPVDRVAELTDGVGADVVFEAVGGKQSHVTDGSDPLAQAFHMARIGGSIVQVGHVIGSVGVSPRKLRKKCVSWINPTRGVVSTGPNADTGRYATQLVADDRVSLSEYITHDFRGLESFEAAVDATLDDPSALGPAQIVLAE